MPRPIPRSLVLLSRLSIGAVLIALAISSSSGAGPAAIFAETKNAAELAHPDVPRTLAAAYYSLRPGLSSTLMLSNQGPHPMQVWIKLFNRTGEPFELEPMTFAGGELRAFDLRALAPKTGFEEGSVQVVYQGANLELGGVLNISDAARGLLFDQELAEPAAWFVSSRLEGIWWRPTRGAKLQLVVTNTTPDPLTATLRLEGISPRQSSPVRIALRSHETRVLEPSDLVGARATLSRAGGISLIHDGPKGGVLAVALIRQAAIGYSDTVELVDPERPVSTRLEGAGLKIGRADGLSLSQVAVLRNVGTAPVAVRGRIPYTAADGRQEVVPLPSFPLAPGEVREIGLAAILARQGVASATAAGLEIDHSGAPGSVIATALAFSADGSQVFRVPMRDAGRTSGTGIYPWSLEGEARAIVYIKNATGEPQDYTMHLEFEGGTYVLGKRTAAPGQTVALDLRELRDRQVPDIFGRVLPLEIIRGKAHWSMNGKDQHVLTGRLEQSDPVRGTSFTVACGACCPNSFVDAYMDPWFVSGGVGGSAQFTVYVQERNCFGSILPWYPTGAYFSSTNPSVASINGSGLATALAPGSTFLQGTIYTSVYRNCAAEAANEEYCCEPTDSYFVCESECQVQPSVTIANGLRKVPLGDDVKTITLTATGNPSGGTYSWSTTSDKVTLSNATSATVTVTSAKASTSRNDVPVTVTYTVNGQSGTASVQLTVQKPSSLSRVANTDNTTAQAACMTSGTPPLAGCGVTRTFRYQVNDQFGDAIEFANMRFWDTITNTQQNGCNLGGYNTTCNNNPPGPCNQSTETGGRFNETLSICAPACRSSSTGACIVGCSTVANQVWTVNGIALPALSVSYQCNKILVNGS